MLTFPDVGLMKKKMITIGNGLLALFLCFALTSCAPLNEPQKGAQGALINQAAEITAQEPAVDQLPVRFQTPSYTIKPLSSSKEFGGSAELTFPVGADISSAAPVALRDIMKQLAQIKGMNISWAKDVDQSATVDVDIRAEDDFYTSVDNLLRQLDYFHEVHGNTLVIKYKDVRKFHIAMPFISSKYLSSVGGDVLGGSKKSGGNMKGQIELTSDENTFDVWSNIQTNLDKVLEIWTAPPPPATPGAQPAGGVQQAAATAPAAPSQPPTGKGYYTIDKPIGLITVTAPRSLLDQIANYIDNLKAELYRQVTIEAKIVEVTLNSDNTTGINWEDLLQNVNNPFNFKLQFNTLRFFTPNPESGRFLTISDQSFGLFLDAIKTQGDTNVISNPKISVMNGQPAMINIGQNVTYVDSVETAITTNAGTPILSYTVNTADIMDGIVLAVVPTILDNNEIILNLSPVTSQLKQPIEYRQFGTAEVGLPVVKVREMNTMVRLKNDEMLVVGGLIDNSETYDSSKIPGLGDIPGVGKLFGQDGTVKARKELVIFLRPRITS